MTIKFISDTLRINDREEIQKILDSLKQKPVKLNTNASFLRKFTLAVIDTFRKEGVHHPEIHDINIDLPEKISVQPKVPLKLNLDLMQVPKKIDIPFDLYLKAPEKINIPKELIEKAPEK